MSNILFSFLLKGARDTAEIAGKQQPSETQPLRRQMLVFAAAAGSGILALCIGCGAPSPVNSTDNPQVAIYVFQAQKPGTAKVEFGTTTAYGLETAPVTLPGGGVPIRIFVAGMRGNTLYHMRAVATYSDGTTETDTDHTFMTGAYPALPTKVTAATSPGQTPQPGIELINGLSAPAEIMATDLSGNVIWAYIPPSPIPAPSTIQAPKLLPNGDFIFLITPGSSLPILNPSAITAATLDEIREINLAGATVQELTLAQLNQELSAANYNLTLLTLHHEVTPLPNGHVLVLGSTIKNVILTGQTTPTNVLGDVVVDLDQNMEPVWVWNEFDHLDVNRQPWNFPDWTHSNAVVYSKDDGNILVSIRHQNWVVKVDYNNGAGTGNIIWRLGEGGDFTLKGGVDPTDWFYAQHGPSFTTANTTGIFGLTLMDNGNDRMYPGGTTQTCGVYGAPVCYSTVPVFQINESTMTATLTFHQIVPPALYNVFGGNAEVPEEVLESNHIEYDLCGVSLKPPSSQIFEVTNEQNPQTVWNLKLTGANAYRAYRLPSLYPGVQW